MIHSPEVNMYVEMFKQGIENAKRPLRQLPKREDFKTEKAYKIRKGYIQKYNLYIKQDRFFFESGAFADYSDMIGVIESVIMKGYNDAMQGVKDEV